MSVLKAQKMMCFLYFYKIYESSSLKLSNGLIVGQTRNPLINLSSEWSCVASHSAWSLSVHPNFMERMAPVLHLPSWFIHRVIWQRKMKMMCWELSECLTRFSFSIPLHWFDTINSNVPHWHRSSYHACSISNWEDRHSHLR